MKFVVSGSRLLAVTHLWKSENVLCASFGWFDENMKSGPWFPQRQSSSKSCFLVKFMQNLKRCSSLKSPAPRWIYTHGASAKSVHRGSLIFPAIARDEREEWKQGAPSPAAQRNMMQLAGQTCNRPPPRYRSRVTKQTRVVVYSCLVRPVANYIPQKAFRALRSASPGVCDKTKCVLFCTGLFGRSPGPPTSSVS